MSRWGSHIWGLLCLAVLVCIWGCNHPASRYGVTVARFEQVLLDTSESDLPIVLEQFRRQYPSPLLHIYPEDERYMSMVSEFRADTIAREVYDTVMRYYPTLSWLEQELDKALIKAYDLDTAITYPIFITYISNAGYATRVTADSESGSVTIAIDEYVTQHMRPYGYFGEPMYIVRQCGAEHIVPDCMSEIARQHIALPSQEMTLLDYMVAEGKVMYFLKLVLPNVEDSVLLRYTTSQLQWMDRNESNVWAYFIHNNLLYERDYGRLHNFIDDAPKTNAFQESAPRTHAYVGWHIVSRYIKKHPRLTLRQLFEETDSQKILYESGYRP
ncbi:MAG: hypothetical protein IJ764_06765 [Bacteroidales bacterium]|nr:hypothetical protein [Bacteroidales bacterium]